MLSRTPQKSVTTTFGNLNGPPLHANLDLPGTSSSSEVVSDSEEDRRQDVVGPRTLIGVIEISSDESDNEGVRLSQKREKRPMIKQLARSRGNFSRRVVIESSDEESDGVEVIELSDSSVEVVKPRQKPITQTLSKSSVLRENKRDPPSSNHKVDESIIVFDEPKNARTPFRPRPPNKKAVTKLSSNPDPQTLSTPKKSQSLAIRATINSSLMLSNDLTTPVSGRLPAKAVAGTPRPNSKKALYAADLQRRQEYAQKIFDDLNKSVFKQGLPENTKLVWNKRLLSTAGKAKFHRSRDGVQTTEIELAEKILDCEERIRNTLSHEMCHLATWVIDNKIDEHHGKLFKSWASRVERKHPYIEVSVRHSYEITYPFEWKCEKCAKIYGRFSKSIKPAECLCGACKEGKLVPQFATGRKPHTPKSSRMAAAKPQDSPRTIAGSSSLVDEDDSDSESEEDVIKYLMESLASTSIGS